MNFFTTTLIAIALLLSGCSTTNYEALKENREKRNQGIITLMRYDGTEFEINRKYGVYHNGLPSLYNDNRELDDIQKALMDRNLYLNIGNNLVVLDSSICPMESVAHRGDFRSNELSENAIIYGNFNGYDHVEIDLLSTWNNGDQYILSHDEYTGRAIGNINGGRPRRIEDSGSAWGYWRIRDKNGQLSNEMPLQIQTAMFHNNYSRNNKQQLNIELKARSFTEFELKTLEEYLSANYAGQYYYTSMIPEYLTFLRRLNPDVYLGIIQKPDNASVQEAVSAFKKGTSKDILYNQYENERDLIESFAYNGYKNNNKLNYLSRQGLNVIHQELGPNSGLHVDIRQYVRHPQLINYAHNKGMKMYTYTINGNQYHIFRLADMRRNNTLPDGAIIDFSPVTNCQVGLGELPNKHSYTPTTELGKMIQALPGNANFEKYTEQVGYVRQGMYLTYWGAIKELPGTSPIVYTEGLRKEADALRKDVGVSLSEQQSITITLD